MWSRHQHLYNFFNKKDIIIYILNTCLPSVNVVFALNVVSSFEHKLNF